MIEEILHAMMRFDGAAKFIGRHPDDLMYPLSVCELHSGHQEGLAAADRSDVEKTLRFVVEDIASFRLALPNGDQHPIRDAACF